MSQSISEEMTIKKTTDISGVYIIDLHPSPNVDPFLKEFIRSTVDGKVFNGEFYNTWLNDSQLNTEWAQTYFAFTTRDDRNTYYHSGRIEGDQVYEIPFLPKGS